MVEYLHMNTPKNSSDYIGDFIVFFSEDEDPEVLFNSSIAEQAYSEAKKIKLETKRNPVVLRVADDAPSIISFALRG